MKEWDKLIDLKIILIKDVIIKIFFILHFDINVLLTIDNRYLFIIQKVYFFFGYFFMKVLHFFGMFVLLDFIHRKYLLSEKVVRRRKKYQ